MSFVYNHAKHLAGDTGLGLGTSPDIRALLVMTPTTADTEDDVTSVAGFSDLREFNGSGYTAGVGGLALTGEAWAKDVTNNRSEFDANDAAFGALGLGTDQIAGIIIIKWVSTQANSIPLCYIDSGGFPFWTNGGTVTSQWNTEGIFQIG